MLFCVKIMNIIIFIILVSVITIKESAGFYSSHLSKNEAKPVFYQNFNKQNKTEIFLNARRNQRHHSYKHKKSCHLGGGCENMQIAYPYLTYRDSDFKRKKHNKPDIIRSKSRELIEWINKEIEHVKIPETINYHEHEPKVLEIEVDNLSSRKELEHNRDHNRDHNRERKRPVVYEHHDSQNGKKHKKYKITYERFDSNQNEYSEKSDADMENGSEPSETDVEKPVKIKYVTKNPHHRTRTDSSDWENDPENEENTPPVLIRVKKPKNRAQAKSQSFNVQPVSIELKEHGDNGDPVIINIDNNLNKKQRRKLLEENEIKFVTSYRTTAIPNNEIYINDIHDQNEQIIDEAKDKSYTKENGMKVNDYRPKLYLNNDEINHLNGMKPIEERNDGVTQLFYIQRDGNDNDKNNNKIFNQKNQLNTRVNDDKPIYIKVENEIPQKSTLDMNSNHRSKVDPVSVQSVNKFNNQQSNCVDKQDGGDAITLLKPLLIEVLDEIKDTKQNTNNEHINSKMQSIQHDLNEKIELIKPTLLEVLNELKENKKLIKREVLVPQSAPVEMIKPMLVNVLEEIKQSNRKTQRVLKELKHDKKQSLRELKNNIEEKIIEKFPTIAHPKPNEVSEQTEYESTKEDNVNTVESDVSDTSQKVPQKAYKNKPHKDEVKKKKFNRKKKHAADHTGKRYSNKKKRKLRKHSHNIHNFRKSEKNNKLYHHKILPSNIFNATEILSSPIKKEMVKDVIKAMTKQRLVSMVSELLADRFIDKLKEEKTRNETRRINHPKTKLIKIEKTKVAFSAVDATTTTEKPVTVQRFEIFLG